MKNRMNGQKSLEKRRVPNGPASPGTVFTDLRLGPGAIDNTLKGLRCQAAQDIRNSNGDIKSMTQGTIVFELIGHQFHLLNVYWDQGLDSLVSPQEIRVIESNLVWH